MYSKELELSMKLEKTSLFVLVEQLVLYAEALISKLKNEKHSRVFYEFGLGNLKRAFNYFMKEEYPEEFLDLKLPSETKSEKKESKTAKKFNEKSKQLALFFKRTFKLAVLQLINAAEEIKTRFENLLFKQSQEFENTYKD